MAQLPPGWTQDKLRNATVDDLRQLPEETLHELDQWVMQDTDAISVVVAAKITHDKRLRREQLGLPPIPSEPSPFAIVDGDGSSSGDAFVELVERNGWDDFGFLLHRIDHTDDERWQRWITEFMRLIDQSIAESDGGERVTDNCVIPISDEPTVNLDSFSEVQRFYREVSKSSAELTDGLDHGICLAADAKAIKSLLEPEDGVEPWVWAIDEHHDFSQNDTIAEGEYPGHFPVAILSLIPDLFPMVATGQSGEEVFACCSFDDAHPIWTTAVEI